MATKARPLEPWAMSLTGIRIVSSGKASHPCTVGQATGFFYKREGVTYLVTNRHVVIDETRGFYPDSLMIRIHTSNVAFETRDVDIPLYGKDGSPTWLEHPIHRDEADVVAINVDSLLGGPSFIEPLSNSNFLPSDEILTLGSTVLIVGYPMGLHDPIHYLPVTKGGTLASSYRIYFGGKPFFLVDADLALGMSGSPVILPVRTRRYVLGGAQMGFYPHSLLGVNSAGHSVAGTKLGLNRVWYASLVEQIVSQIS